MHLEAHLHIGLNPKVCIPSRDKFLHKVGNSLKNRDKHWSE